MGCENRALWTPSFSAEQDVFLTGAVAVVVSLILLQSLIHNFLCRLVCYNPELFSRSLIGLDKKNAEKHTNGEPTASITKIYLHTIVRTNDEQE